MLNNSCQRKKRNGTRQTIKPFPFNEKRRKNVNDRIYTVRVLKIYHGEHKGIQLYILAFWKHPREHETKRKYCPSLKKGLLREEGKGSKRKGYQRYKNNNKKNVQNLLLQRYLMGEETRNSTNTTSKNTTKQRNSQTRDI